MDQVAVCLVFLVLVPAVVLGSYDMQITGGEDDLSHDEWDYVFRANAGNGHSVLQAWTTGYGTRPHPPRSSHRSCTAHYRHRKISVWEHLHVARVRLTLYENRKEVAYILFNGEGSTSMNWFHKSRVLDSSWCDVHGHSSYNFFSIEGDGRFGRRFFINRNYGGCGRDIGNFVVSDTDSTKACFFDTHPVYPQIVYSKISAAERWDKKMFGRADYFTIHLQYKDDNSNGGF